jgi:hypothetical protein
MTRTLLLAALLAAVAVLVLTNPSRDDFARFYADRASAEVARELGVSGALGDVLGGAAQSLLETALRESVDRRSWLLASTFTVPTAEEDPVYLGIAGTFVPMSTRR